MRLGLVNRFTEHSQLITDNNYNGHTSQSTLKVTEIIIGTESGYGLDDQKVGDRVQWGQESNIRPLTGKCEKYQEL
jgi:hypothetical protein